MPLGFWLSQNRSALLLVRTTTDFQVSSHVARFLSSLHPLPNFLILYVLPGRPSVTKSCAGGVTPFWQQDRSWAGVEQGPGGC